jgi:hypothetical protein
MRSFNTNRPKTFRYKNRREGELCMSIGNVS